MNIFIIYLIVINIIGFILFKINSWLYSNTKNGQIDILITIIHIIGGSLGVFISMYISKRKKIIN